MNQKERFDLVVLLGETLLSNGGEIFRTNELMRIAARQYGIEQFNSFTIANGIFVSALMDGCQYSCQVRHVPLMATHLGRIEAINELSRRIAAGTVPPERAREAVEQIRAIRGASPITQIAGAAIGSGCFCFLFGGYWIDCLASFAAGLMLCAFGVLISRGVHMPKVMHNLISASFATVVCCVFWKLGFGLQVDKMIIGTIFQLVPGVPFTTAVRNFMENDYIAGMVRLMDALLIAGCISVGVGATMIVWSAVFGGVMP